MTKPRGCRSDGKAGGGPNSGRRFGPLGPPVRARRGSSQRCNVDSATRSGEATGNWRSAVGAIG
jgi:hypothetical protein